MAAVLQIQPLPLAGYRIVDAQGNMDPAFRLALQSFIENITGAVNDVLLAQAAAAAAQDAAETAQGAAQTAQGAAEAAQVAAETVQTAVEDLGEDFIGFTGDFDLGKAYLMGYQ